MTPTTRGKNSAGFLPSLPTKLMNTLPTRIRLTILLVQESRSTRRIRDKVFSEFAISICFIQIIIHAQSESALECVEQVNAELVNAHSVVDGEHMGDGHVPRDAPLRRLLEKSTQTRNSVKHSIELHYIGHQFNCTQTQWWVPISHKSSLHLAVARKQHISMRNRIRNDHPNFARCGANIRTHRVEFGRPRREIPRNNLVPTSLP